MQVLLELRVVPLEQKCLLVLFSEKKHEKLHGELNFNQRIWLKNVCFCNRGSFYLFIFFCHCKIYFLMCTTVVVLQSFSCVWLFVTPWTVACQASLSFTTFWSYSNFCPLSQWCHPIISSSVIPFSCLQSFPALGSFLMNQLFASGGKILCTIACFIAKNISKVWSLKL